MENNYGMYNLQNKCMPQLVTTGCTPVVALWMGNPLNQRLKSQGRIPHEMVRNACCHAQGCKSRILPSIMEQKPLLSAVKVGCSRINNMIRHSHILDFQALFLLLSQVISTRAGSLLSGISKKSNIARAMPRLIPFNLNFPTSIHNSHAFPMFSYSSYPWDL